MTLQEVYEKAKYTLPEELHPRLERAVEIVQGHLGVVKNTYKINGSSEVRGIYTVSHAKDGVIQKYVIDRNEASCTCPDFDKARSGWCKHRLAVSLLIRLNEEPKKKETQNTQVDVTQLIDVMTLNQLTSLRRHVKMNGKTYVLAIWEE